MILKAKQIERSSALRHALFVCVNAALAACLYFVVVSPLRQLLAEAADGATQRRATLARYEAVANSETAVQEYARLVTESNARGELLDGASEGIVNANLQARLKSLAESAGATVRSIEILPVKTLRGATLVGAKILVAGTLAPIHALARALEGQSPLLLVMAASLRGEATPWGVPVEGEQNIEAQFDVYGGAVAGALVKEAP